MINWENLNCDINKASKDFEKLKVKSTSIEPINPRNEFIELRQKLIKARDNIFEAYNLDKVNKLDYPFDLLFGLEVYQILNEDIGFANRVATNDDVWRYLSIYVIPDIVHSRWSLNADHFYKISRRIWLKTIWWYIHLSWRGNKKDTYEILKNNSTDTILQLVERPGIGYYVEMYRELMLQYSTFEDKSRDLFRRVLKLNTARLLTISPELVEGGLQGYVSDLFETVQNRD
ncbi:MULTISPECIES: hypothetical protein [Bacilli]|uniref:Uncharacterized protein n=1 Tax=Lysinibacillus capsici TaxID=2115968 RepID=A0ABY8KR94_9BACI|nr:hypothetical protein [Lysinibacillus capsici]WGF40654.1 hypothetical protein QBO96_10565 [Lysinibacillus capsici]